MPMPKTDEAYNKNLKSVRDVLVAEATASLNEPALEEKSSNDDLVPECQAMFDGT